MVEHQRDYDERRQARREQRLEADDLASQEGDDLEGDEEEDVREEPPRLLEFDAVEERIENEEEEEALLIRGDRAVRGVIGEQGDLAGRLHPDVPAPLIGPLNQDGDGWRDIDRLGAWECALNPFSSLEEVPLIFRVTWGKVVNRVITAILRATDQEEMDRGLKWLLILPAALLRQAQRGGQNGRGRAELAGRFRAASDDDWGYLISDHLSAVRQGKRGKEEADREQEGGKTGDE